MKTLSLRARICAIVFYFLTAFAAPALAQWQVPLGYVPIGRGPGNTGFDSVPYSTLVPGAYPGPNDPAVALGTVTGHTLAPLEANVVYNGNGVYPFQIDSTNPYVVGISGVIASSTVAQTFNITFTSTHLVGSPVTVGYTAVGGDTVSTIATRLCTAINANTNLNFNGTGLPLFCQANGGGQFNLQWNVLYSDLTAASVGTGSITGLSSVVRLLDYTRFVIGRRIPGYVGQAGDSISCLSIYGQSTSGAMDAVVGNFCGALQGVGPGSVTGELTISNSLNSAGIAEIGMKDGLIVYDSANAAPTGGYLGRGKINLPTTGAIRLGGTAGCGLTQNETIACGNNLVGGLNPGSALNLQSTDNASPSADFVQITTNNTVRQKWFNSGGATMGSPTGGDPGAGFLNVAGGLLINNIAAITASSTATLTNKTYDTAGTGNVFKINGTTISAVTGTGAAVLATSPTLTTPVISSIVNTGTLTLPTSTDTLVGRATTDTLTNKTYDTAGAGNVFKINGTGISAITGTGAAVLATSPTLVTPTLGAASATSVTAANGTSNGFILTAATGTNGSLSMGAGNSVIFTLGSTLDAFAVNDHSGNTVLSIVESTPGTLATAVGTFTGTLGILSTTAIPAGGTAAKGYMFSSTASFGVFFGSGVPTLAAAKGSLYLRSDGSSTSTRAYINTDGSTTWTNLTTGAWLLQRDLDPAANDNNPAFMEKVA